jgi:hypothetical protein
LPGGFPPVSSSEIIRKQELLIRNVLRGNGVAELGALLVFREQRIYE